MNIVFAGFRHGHIFSLYREALKTPAVTIAGCIEPDKKAADDAAKKLNIAFSDKDYAAFLDDPTVDAIAVGAYYSARGALILQAAEAGKHVITDKPVCIHESELRAIETAFTEKNLVLACLMDLRFLSVTAAARSILHSGRLGAVRNVSFTGQHGLEPLTRPAWYFEAGKHGGTINDIAIHGVDLVRYTTGLELTEVHAARAWNAYATATPDFKDCAIFMAALGNGAGLLADVSYSAPDKIWPYLPTYWNFDFWCETGMLNLNMRQKQLRIYDSGSATPELIKGAPTDMSALRDFIARTNGASGIQSNEDIFNATRQTLALQRAADGNIPARKRI